MAIFDQFVSNLITRVSVFGKNCFDEITSNTLQTNFEEAQQICSNQNMRLCTREELLERNCCGLEGGCDSRPIWTSSFIDGNRFFMLCIFLNSKKYDPKCASLGEGATLFRDKNGFLQPYRLLKLCDQKPSLMRVF